MKPAYQKFHKNPKKNYGIGCVRVFMVLKGKKGCAHFSYGTGMYLPETYKKWKDEGKEALMIMGTPYMGYDVGYHAYKPQWEGQDPYRDIKTTYGTKYKGKDAWKNIKVKKGKILKCSWLGTKCYTDGSAMRAEEYMKVLVSKGSDAIWKLLEGEYNLLK